MFAGFEESFESNVHLWQDQGHAGIAGRGHQPDDRPPGGGDREGQPRRGEGCLSENGSRCHRKVGFT